MSARLVSLVLASGLPAYLRLPAVVMAHHAAPDGSRVFPSVRRVASSCGLTERRTRAILAELRALGVIRSSGSTRFGTVRYVFEASRLPAPAGISTASTGFQQIPCYGQQGGVLPAAADPSVIDQETLLGDPSGEMTENPDGERTARLELLEGIRGKVLRMAEARPAAGRRRRLTS